MLHSVLLHVATAALRSRRVLKVTVRRRRVTASRAHQWFVCFHCFFYSQLFFFFLCVRVFFFLCRQEKARLTTKTRCVTKP